MPGISVDHTTFSVGLQVDGSLGSFSVAPEALGPLNWGQISVGKARKEERAKRIWRIKHGDRKHEYKRCSFFNRGVHILIIR